MLSTGVSNNITADILATSVWLILPLFLGFSGYLMPKLGRAFVLAVALVSLGYGISHILDPTATEWQLIDSFGVSLRVDGLSGYFVATNALVTAAVALYCWPQNRSSFFYAQLTILHGSLNSIFLSNDFISLYVGLEVVSIAAFLLITYSRTDRAIWIGLRYLFISNTAMLFYLVGAVQVYKFHRSFAFAGLADAPIEAMVLILLGLLTKGGIFILGLWLPQTHGESETPVSAMLSGVVVKAGIFPLVRCSLLMEPVAATVTPLAAGAATVGLLYAILEQDTKRILAASTLSQMGFVLVAPAAAGPYALTHGLAKACLFLGVGNWPSRQLEALKIKGVPWPQWLIVALPALSIAGFPLIGGFGAKSLTIDSLDEWLLWWMSAAAVGSVIVMAKLLFLPIRQPISFPWKLARAAAPLLAGLFIVNAAVAEAYAPKYLLKAAWTVALGWLLYGTLLRGRLQQAQLPRTPENLEHLIGVMSLMLAVLFGMILV